MKIEENFISYELALKLKEKEFDEECLGGYISNGLTWEIVTGSKYQALTNDDFDAPLYQQVIDWLLNVHDIFLSPTYRGKIKQYDCCIETEDDIRFCGYKPTIQEAYIAAIEEALKLI